MSTPKPVTSADHLAWAICTSIRPDRDDDGERPCQVPCRTCRIGAAAALRAVADHVVPEVSDCGVPSHDYNKGAEDRQRVARFRLFAIVTELEKLNA